MTKSWPTGQSLDTDDSVAARIRKAEEAIAGLRANFAAWVRVDIDAVERHLSAAQAAQDRGHVAEQLEALRRIAHNIKGQGGTFGCVELSAAAAEIDRFLKGRAGAADLPAVDQLVRQLQAAYARELT